LTIKAAPTASSEPQVRLSTQCNINNLHPNLRRSTGENFQSVQDFVVGEELPWSLISIQPRGIHSEFFNHLG
jgi:hypothetical protein